MFVVIAWSSDILNTDIFYVCQSSVRRLCASLCASVWLRYLQSTETDWGGCQTQPATSHVRTLYSPPPPRPLYIFWCSFPPPLRSQTVHSAARQCHQAYLVIIFILTVLMFLLTLTSDVLVSQMGLCPPETVSLNRVQKISSPPTHTHTARRGTNSRFKLLLNIVCGCSAGQMGGIDLPHPDS